MDSNAKNEGVRSSDQIEEALLDQAESLIWALLDDHIEPADVKALEDLLKEYPPVRDRYVECVQMHCDLHQHFCVDEIPAELPKSPVLGSLGELRPGTDTLPLRE